MFDQDFGSRATRWLKWFMLAMLVYALSSLWPDNRVVAIIGMAGAVAGIAIARNRIAKSRKGG